MNQTVQFFLALGLMIAFAKAMGYLSYRLNQPAVLGELLAGLILGPTVLNFLGIPTLFPDGEAVGHTLIEMAEIGVLLLMFMAGLEIDLTHFLEVGRPALLAGSISVLVPVVVIPPAVVAFGYSLEKAIFVGILLASMSTSITAQVMIELGVIRRREGLALLGAALIDDAIVILLVSLFVALNPGGIIAVAESRSIAEVLLRIFGFLVIGSLASWYLLPRLANLIKRLPISEGPLMLAVVSALLLSFAAEFFGGIAGITGAFLAGLALGRARRGVVEEIERGLHSLNYSLFVPLFFVSIGLRTNLRLLTADLLPFALVIVVLAVVTKVLGAGWGARLGGFDMTSSIRLSVGMISRGEVGLVIAALGVDYGILSPEVFTVIVFVVLVTTIMTPPLVRWSFREPPAPTEPDAEELATNAT